MKRIFIQTISFTLGLLLFVGISIIYAWTEPTKAPPLGNVAAPINISTTTQYKSGALGVGGVFHGYSTGIFDGNVGIGTAVPVAKLQLGTQDWMMFDASVGNSSAGILFYETQGRSATDVQYGARIFYHEGTDTLRIVTKENNADTLGIAIARASGNVGIGTTNPGAAKLDVNGFLRVWGTFEVRSAPPYADVAYFNLVNTSFSPAYNWQIQHTYPSAGLHFFSPTNGEVMALSKEGNLSVTGSKNFVIDHPLDPKNKKLVHSTLEGPEAAVFYRGKGRLESGKATVELPDYFEALTRKEGRTVLLTPVFEDEEAVSQLAASQVKDGKFQVRAIDNQSPNQKFYWEVKAVRADIPLLETEPFK